MSSFHRQATTFVFACAISACTSEGSGADGTTMSSSSSSSSSSSTTTTTSADETSGGPVCTDEFGGNDDIESAYPLPLGPDDDEANDYRFSISAEVCPNESDFFRYQPPCAGYLGVEVVVDEDGDDVTVLLRDAVSELQRSEGNPSTSRGAYRMEAIHSSVDTTELFIEVQHVDGDQVPYTVTTYFLPSGSCMSGSWGCEATNTLAATETSCTAEPSCDSSGYEIQASSPKRIHPQLA